MAILVGDTLYFDANDGNNGRELWAHDTSNHSTWQVVDIISGTSWWFGSNPGEYMSLLVGDILFFSADNNIWSDNSELWAMKIEHSITYD